MPSKIDEMIETVKVTNFDNRYSLIEEVFQTIRKIFGEDSFEFKNLQEIRYLIEERPQMKISEKLSNWEKSKNVLIGKLNSFNNNISDLNDKIQPVLFICWSGILSENITKKVKDLFEKIYPNTKIFYSGDIEKGSVWFEQISKKLQECYAGILIITPENKDSRWMHFESGAISIGTINKKAAPVLFGVSKKEIQTPLNLFQITEFGSKESKKDFLKLVNSLNEGNMGENVEETFNQNWDNFRNDINRILKTKENNNLKGISAPMVVTVPNTDNATQKKQQDFFAAIVKSVEKTYDDGLEYANPLSELRKYGDNLDFNITIEGLNTFYLLNSKYILNNHLTYNPEEKYDENKVKAPLHKSIGNYEWQNIVKDNERLNFYNEVLIDIQEKHNVTVKIPEDVYPDDNRPVRRIIGKILKSITEFKVQDNIQDLYQKLGNNVIFQQIKKAPELILISKPQNESDGYRFKIGDIFLTIDSIAIKISMDTGNGWMHWDSIHPNENENLKVMCITKLNEILSTLQRKIN